MFGPNYIPEARVTWETEGAWRPDRVYPHLRILVEMKASADTHLVNRGKQQVTAYIAEGAASGKIRDDWLGVVDCGSQKFYRTFHNGIPSNARWSKVGGSDMLRDIVPGFDGCIQKQDLDFWKRNVRNFSQSSSLI